MANGSAPIPDVTSALHVAVKFQQQNWVIAVTVNSVCLVILSWMCFTMILYGFHTNKWKSDRTNSLGQASAGRVYTLAVAAMLSGFIRLCSDQAGFNVGYAPNSQHACYSAFTASLFGYMASLSLVYVFLWLRQRALYRHPLLAQHYNMKLKAVSYISIVVIVIGLVLSFALYVAFNQYTTTANGCELTVQTDATQWPAYMSTGVTTIGQLLMLFLFAYPLRLNSARRSKARIERLIKRSVAMVAVCMFSDAFAAAYLKAPPAAHLPWLFYSLNMFLNLVAVYLSFETWTDMCVSPFRLCRKSEDNIMELNVVS